MIVAYQSTESSRYEPPWPTSDEELKKITAWFASTDDYLKVELKASGRLVGLLSINRRRELEGRYHNLGYIFHPEAQGYGYATEACRTVISHLFREWRIDGFVTGTHPDNEASVNLLTRLGFHQDRPDVDEYSLSRKDWEKQGQHE